MCSPKVLEKLVAEQLKDFLDAHGLLSNYQSGFSAQYKITAAVKVVNDIIEALDGRKYCAALFMDLSKAFNTVDHVILADKLYKIGISSQAVNWFSDYLSDRTQCVQAAGSFPPFLPVLKARVYDLEALYILITPFIRLLWSYGPIYTV